MLSNLVAGKMHEKGNIIAKRHNIAIGSPRKAQNQPAAQEPTESAQQASLKSGAAKCFNAEDLLLASAADSNNSIGDLIKPDDAFSFVEVIRQFISVESKLSQNERQLETPNEPPETLEEAQDASNVSNLNDESDNNTSSATCISSCNNKLKTSSAANLLAAPASKFASSDETDDSSAASYFSTFIPIDFNDDNNNNNNNNKYCYKSDDVVANCIEDASYKIPARNWKSNNEKLTNRTLINQESDLVPKSLENVDFNLSNLKKTALSLSTTDLMQQQQHPSGVDQQNAWMDLQFQNNTNAASSMLFSQLPNGAPSASSLYAGANPLVRGNFAKNNLVKPIFHSNSSAANASASSCDLIQSTMATPPPAHHHPINNQNSASPMDVFSQKFTQNNSANQKLDSTNLYLTGFGSNFTYKELDNLLNDFKPIMSYRIINGDTENGIAFARLKTPEIAAKAVQQLNGMYFNKSKKMLRVKLANKQLPRSAMCLKYSQQMQQSSSISQAFGSAYNAFNQQQQQQMASTQSYPDYLADMPKSGFNEAATSSNLHIFQNLHAKAVAASSPLLRNFDSNRQQHSSSSNNNEHLNRSLNDIFREFPNNSPIGNNNSHSAAPTNGNFTSVKNLTHKFLMDDGDEDLRHDEVDYEDPIHFGSVSKKQPDEEQSFFNQPECLLESLWSVRNDTTKAQDVVPNAILGSGATFIACPTSDRKSSSIRNCNLEDSIRMNLGKILDCNSLNTSAQFFSQN